MIGLIGAASYAVDLVAAALGARHVGASRSAVACGRESSLQLEDSLAGAHRNPAAGKHVDDNRTNE